MFYHSYEGYLQNAYPYDELKPLSCTGMDTWGSFSLTLVDALDTLIVMGNYSEFDRAAKLVLKSININANVNVSVFETTIRVVGGLISAHMLSGIAGVQVEPGWPCTGPLLTLAERLADKLMPGMPYGTVNLKYGVHSEETPITCTAGVGTFLLEFGALSRLTSSPHFERVAMKALKELWLRRSSINLVGNHINVQTGQWTATDAGIGAGVDSYFEYLVKAGMLFNKPSLIRQFYAYKNAIDKHIKHDDWFMWVSMGKGQVTMPIYQSLEQFWPGLLTLIGELDEAKKTMLNYHQVLRQYGFSPEFFNIPNMDVVQKRSGYPLRPEFVESLMYLYRATKDPLYLHMGVDVVEAIEHSAKTKCGYATVQNVKDHTLEDRMESFFLAETTKYLYLLFDPDNFLHNSGEKGRIVDTPSGKCVIETGSYIFNTESHPLDPSILYCCSSQRKRDIDVLTKFHENIDLLAVLGIDGRNEWATPLSDTDNSDDLDGSSMQNVKSVQLPDLVQSTITELDDGVEGIVINGKMLKKSESSSVDGGQFVTNVEINGAAFEIGYDVQSVSGDSSSFKFRSVNVSDNAEDTVQLKELQKTVTEKVINEQTIQDSNGRTTQSQHVQIVFEVKDATPEILEAEMKTVTEKEPPLQPDAKNGVTNLHRESTSEYMTTTSVSLQQSQRQKFLEAVSFPICSAKFTGVISTTTPDLPDGVPHHTVVLNDESLRVAYQRLHEQLKQFIVAAKRLNSEVHSEEKPSLQVKVQLPEVANEESSSVSVCQIYDRVTDSRTLNRLINLFFVKSDKRTAFLRPVCVKGERFMEEDLYINSRPNTASLKGFERDAYLDGPVTLQTDFRSFNTKDFGQYRYRLMSCRRRPFESRLSYMGETLNLIVD